MSGPDARRGIPPWARMPATAAGWLAVADGPHFLEVLDAAGVDAEAWAALGDGQRGKAAELVVRDGWPVEAALRIAAGEAADPA